GCRLRLVDAPAAEVRAVGKGWMRAGDHAVFGAALQRPRHAVAVARMPAAGNGGARGQRKEVHRGARPLPQVRIEVDGRSHRRASHAKVWAWATVTGVKRTTVPGRCCAKRSRSTLARVAMRG